MKCKKCNVECDKKSKSLICFVCSGEYHLSCLDNVTESDFDYLKSASTNWKCIICDKQKSLRSDDTPVTPSDKKKAKGNQSEVDSDSSTTGSGSKTNVCGKCNRGFSFNAHRANCSRCDAHFHFKCINLAKEEFAKIKSKWLCTICTETVEVDRMGPIKSGIADKSGLSVPDKTIDTGEVSMKDLMRELIVFKTEIKQTNLDMTNSLNSYSEWIVENGKKIDLATSKILELTTEISNLRQENVNLKKNVHELTVKVNTLEQAAKDNVLEIHGVPFKADENLLEIVGKLSEVVGFEFSENMVDNCYRYKSREDAKSKKSKDATDRPGGIVVKFVRKIDMDLFVKKLREKRNVNTRHLGFMDGQSNPVYVNNSLTQWKRQLFNSAKKAKAEKQYTYLWVRSGRIFMRKNQGDRFVPIDSEEDIAKLA